MAVNSNGTQIHSTAIIEKGAELGVGVKVGAYSIIGPNAIIDDGTEISSHVVISGRTKIGKRNKIWSFATLGSAPQDLKYKGEDTELLIGDDNMIREYVNISIGTEGGGNKTIIGSRNLLMVYCHIAHDCNIGNDCIFANAVNVAGHVVAQDFAVFGGMAAIHQFCRVGKLAMIAGGSMVVQDIPPFCMVHGDRATINGLNVVGLKRANLRGEILSDIKNMYRLLYRENLTMEDAIKRIQSEVQDSPEKKVFVDFLKGSDRGVVR